MKKKWFLLIISCLLCIFGGVACGDEAWYGSYYYDTRCITITEDYLVNAAGEKHSYELNGDVLISGGLGHSATFYNDYKVLSFGLSDNFYYGNIPVTDGYFDARIMLTQTEILSFSADGTYQYIYSEYVSQSHEGQYQLKDGIIKIKGRYLISHAPTETSYHRIVNDGYGLDSFVYVKNPDIFFDSVDTFG